MYPYPTLPAAAPESALRHRVLLRAHLLRASDLEDAIVLHQRPPACHVFLWLRKLFHQFRLEMEAYLDLEAAQFASETPSLANGAVAAESIFVLRQGQEAIMEAISEIREITEGFTPPQGACAPFVAWIETLRAIHSELALKFQLDEETLFAR